MTDMKTVIVSGATGFIGSYLVRELLKNGSTVYGIGTNIARLEGMNFGENFIPVTADFRVYDSLDRQIKARDVDAFFHMAWCGGAVAALKDYQLQFTNAKASCDAAMSAARIGCRKFIFAGTINELEIAQFLRNEKTIPRNTNIYASMEVSADITSRTISYNNHMDYCSAFIPLPYGVGYPALNLINTVIKNCMENKPSRLIEGNNQYDIVHVSDIARALYLIGSKGRNMQSYYIGHRKLRTFREIVCNIRDVVNKDAELRFGEYEDSLNMDYSYTDLDALYRDTGFECTADFEQTIREQAEYLKAINA